MTDPDDGASTPAIPVVYDQPIPLAPEPPAPLPDEPIEVDDPPIVNDPPTPPVVGDGGEDV